MFPKKIKRYRPVISKLEAIDYHFYWVGVIIILFLQLFKALDGLTTHWLADQSNVAQHFMYWHKNYFYGVYMSGTNPIVYTFGPVAIFLLSFPSLLGFNPEVAHQTLILLNTSGLLLLAWILRESKEHRFIFFIFYFVLMFATNYWLILTIFWLNSLLVFFALLFLSAMVYYFNKPTLNSFFLFLCASCLPLHVHSSPAFVIPLVLYAIGYHILVIRSYDKLSFFTKAILFITFVPYLLGELYNEFDNAAAILQNIIHNHYTQRIIGITGGKQALDSFFQHHGINYSWFGVKNYNSVDTWKGIFIIINILGMIIISFFKRFAYHWQHHYWRCFPFLLLFHFLFFYITNRQIISPHYLTFSTIIYSMGYALVIGLWLSKLYFNSLIIIVILLVIQVQSINYSREVPYWSYRRMTVILDEIAKDTDNICMLYNPNFEPSAGKRYNSLEFLLLNYYNKNLTYKRDSDFCVYFIRGGIKSQDIDPNYSFYKKIGEAEIYKRN